MALYKILFMPSTKKDLRSIPKIERIKILKHIDTLTMNPRPPGCEKLTAQNRYRIRQGDYRIIYTIHDNELIIWIIKVGHRRDIYRISEQKVNYHTRVNTKQ